MSIDAFTKTVKKHITDAWLDSLSNNIIANSTEVLREGQQLSGKTDFILNKYDIKDIYKTITGDGMSLREAEYLLSILTDVKRNKPKEVPITIKRGTREIKTTAYIFKEIGFDTISNKLNSILLSSNQRIGALENAYANAEDAYIIKQTIEINAGRVPLDGTDEMSIDQKKQLTIKTMERNIRGKIGVGYFFNKGHVIGIATKLTQQFKEEINKAKFGLKKERNIISDVLDQYIKKLEADDLASANLPNAVTQEVYAEYRKSSSRYLVEMQLAITNQGAGSQVSATLVELKKLFTSSVEDITNILKQSPTLGRALATDQGSPSYLDLIGLDIASIISTGKKAPSKEYRVSKTLVDKTTSKVIKPKSNKQEIAQLRAFKNKLKSAKSDPNNLKVISGTTIPINLSALQGLINQHLQNVISANMGDGSQRNILNYRTGRFAGSTKVESMSQSRAGMITAFYSYMKNPYATFAEGGKQENPRTRNPKLLISKSIREIAMGKVGNRLRAVAL